MALTRHDNPLSATLAGLFDLVGRRKAAGVSLPCEDRLDGRTCLVTGANTGLGKATATGLARLGARVIMACRSGIPEAGEDVKRASGSDAVEMMSVDLADLASIVALCDRLAERDEHLDVAILNAGVVPSRARRSAQGLELMFAVNYLANVALLARLLEDGVIPNRTLAGNATPPKAPRIILVSSESHRSADPIDFDHLGDFVDYNTMGSMAQYAHSKLLLSTYASELARRLSSGGETDVAVHHLCPGAVNTNIAREAPEWVKPALGAVMRRFFRDPEQAAQPVLYLAAAREIEGRTGLYLHMEVPKAAGERATSPEHGRRLWERTHELLEALAPARALDTSSHAH